MFILSKKLIALSKESALSFRGVTGFNFKTKKAKGLAAFLKVIEARLAEIEKGHIRGDVIFFVPLAYAHPISVLVYQAYTGKKIPEGTQVMIGIQSVSPELSFEESDSKDEVEHTGSNVSAMFADKDLGVVAGLNAHSETFDPDAIVQETDAIASHRVFHTARHLPITTVAVGETSEQRAAGKEVYIQEVQRQLRERLALLTASINSEVLDTIPEKLHGLFISDGDDILSLLEKGQSELIIAYEPIWSIGERAVGKATPKEALEMLIPMFEILVEMFGLEIALKIRFQYGGSLNGEKAPEFAQIEEIYEVPGGNGRKVRLFYHGGLVGGAAYKDDAHQIPQAFNRD